MKKSNKIIIGLAIFCTISLISYLALNSSKSCKYRGFIDSIVVSGFNVNNQINFTSVGNTKIKYYLYLDGIKKLDKSITLQDLEQKGNIFKITGDKIESGTCSPHIILSFTKTTK